MKQRKSYTDENVFRHLIRTFSSFLWVPKGGMKKNNSVLRKYFPQIRSSISSSDLQLQLQIGVMTFWYRKECHWLYLISALQAFCFFCCFFLIFPPKKYYHHLLIGNKKWVAIVLTAVYSSAYLNLKPEDNTAHVVPCSYVNFTFMKQSTVNKTVLFQDPVFL